MLLTQVGIRLPPNATAENESELATIRKRDISYVRQDHASWRWAPNDDERLKKKSGLSLFGSYWNRLAKNHLFYSYPFFLWGKSRLFVFGANQPFLFSHRYACQHNKKRPRHPVLVETQLYTGYLPPPRTPDIYIYRYIDILICIFFEKRAARGAIPYYK